MAEKINAYEVLGLKEDAGKEEIVKRYNILYKKYKTQKNGNASRDGISIDDVNRAYNELMGYDSGEKGFDGRGKKLSNFLYYYKIHVIVGILVLVAVISIVKTFTGYVEPDLKIALVGNFPFQGVERLENQIYGNINEVKKVEIDSVIYWDKKDANMQSAMEVKLGTLVLKGNEDVYLLDKEKFDFLIERGALKNLDNLLQGNGNTGLNKKEYKAKSKNEQSEHIYGYDVSGSSMVKDLMLPGGKMILALGCNGKNDNNTLEFMRLLLSIS